MDELSGKVALVTGASRGIGRAIAIALAEAGIGVVVNYRDRRSDAEETAAAIESAGSRAVVVQSDVSRSEDVERLVAAANRVGPVGILINNAGIARVQTIEEATEKDWDDILDVNLKSCFLVTQAVLKTMRAARWGRIVNMSSIAAHVGGVVGAHYAASKAGMLGLTHYYAARLMKEGITVNAIAPALIETDMVTQDLKITPDLIPAGRFGRPGEVSDIVMLLVRNAFITGQTIHVNGGRYFT